MDKGAAEPVSSENEYVPTSTGRPVVGRQSTGIFLQDGERDVVTTGRQTPSVSSDVVVAVAVGFRRGGRRRDATYFASSSAFTRPTRLPTGVGRRRHRLPLPFFSFIWRRLRTGGVPLSETLVRNSRLAVRQRSRDSSNDLLARSQTLES